MFLTISEILKTLPNIYKYLVAEKDKNISFLVKTILAIGLKIEEKGEGEILLLQIMLLQQSALSILGADVSSLQHALDLGAEYFYEDGTRGHPLEILSNHGVNYIRLRVWVNPANGYNNKEKVVKFAPLIRAYGYKLLIDFHYSDIWADPEHQIKPATWGKNNFNQLKKDLYEHTFDVLSSLKSIGSIPEMVQIGNEINPGMLLPDGSITNWDGLGLVVDARLSGCKSLLRRYTSNASHCQCWR